LSSGLIPNQANSQQTKNKKWKEQKLGNRILYLDASLKQQNEFG
jgi:hypothetical protein